MALIHEYIPSGDPRNLSGRALGSIGLKTITTPEPYDWMYTQQKLGTVNQKDIYELYNLLDKYGMSMQDAIKLIKQIHEENEIS